VVCVVLLFHQIQQHKQQHKQQTKEKIKNKIIGVYHQQQKEKQHDPPKQ
jgi:hypothetical protein